MALAVAEPSQADMVTLIVTDHSLFPAPATRSTVTLAADVTLQAAHECVAAELQLVPGTFELRRGADEMQTVYRLGDDSGERTLAQEGMDRGKARLHCHGVNGNTPVRTGVMPGFGSSSVPASATAEAALGTVMHWSQQRGHAAAPVYGPATRHGSRPGASAPAAPNAEGFVGLVNQGATCYLSSLLQSLYFTPEFRAALYEVGASEALPCQRGRGRMPGAGEARARGPERGQHRRSLGAGPVA